MAISYLCGFEMGSTSEPQFVSGGTVSTTSSVTNGGGFAVRLNPAASTAYFHLSVRTTGGTFPTFAQSVRFYLRVGSLPTAAYSLVRFLSASTDAGNASGNLAHGMQLNTNGTVATQSNVGVTATSTNALSADGLFHRIDVDCGWNAGAGMNIYVDGSLWVTDSSITTSTVNKLRLGQGTSNTADLYLDDVAVYDSALPATLNAYSLGLLKPVADNAVGNWKRNDGVTTLNEWSAVDNTPPTGTAVTAVLGTNYIQNGVAGSGVAADRIDLGMQAYTNITGLTDAAQVLAVMPITNDAQQVTTGSPKSGAMSVYTNPASGLAQTFDFGLPNGTSGSGTAAAQGAFPAGWGTHTGAVIESPAITNIAAGAGVRVARTGTYTRVVSLDFVGLYVMWEAATAAAFSQPLSMADRRIVRNSLLRR